MSVSMEGSERPLIPEDDVAVKTFRREVNAYFGVLFIIDCVLVTLGVLSNLFVCIVMSRSRHFKKTLSNCYIFHLAIADLAFRGVGIFHIVREMLLEGHLSLEHCKITVFTESTCGAVVLFFLAGIALDRYNNVFHPVRSLGKKRRRLSVVLLAWFIAVVTSMPFLFSATNRQIEHNFLITREEATTSNKSENSTAFEYILKKPLPSCISGHHKQWSTLLSTTVYFLFAFLAPLLIIFIAYTRVLAYLEKRAQLRSLNSAVARSKGKAIRMMLFIVLSFLLSWGPIMVLKLFQSYSSRRSIVQMGTTFVPIRPLLECLCKSSSILNPVIYAFGNSNFRKNARRLFCKT